MTLNNFAICRMCVKETRVMISLFGEDELWKKLKAISKIEISEGDDLPQQVCMTCARDAAKAFTTKSKCETADLILRRAISDSTFNLRSVDIAVLTNETPQVANDTSSGANGFPTGENGFPINIKQEVVDPSEQGQDTGIEPRAVTKTDAGRDTTSAWTTIGASTSNASAFDFAAQNENLQATYDGSQQMMDNESFGQDMNEPGEGGEGNSLFECTVCKKFYKRKFFFDKHISTGLCVKRTDTPKCIDCNEVFPSNHHLGSHRRYKHCATTNVTPQEVLETEKKKEVEHNYFIPIRKRRIRRRRKRLLYTRRKRERPMKDIVLSAENGKDGENEGITEEEADGAETMMDEDVNFPSPINEDDINGLEKLMELGDETSLPSPSDKKMDFGCHVSSFNTNAEKSMDMDVNDLKTRYLKRKLILSFKKDKTGKYFHSFSKDVNDSFPSNETFLNANVKIKRKNKPRVDAIKYEKARQLLNEYTSIHDFASRLDVSIPTAYKLKRKAEREITHKEEPESTTSADESQLEKRFEECNENSTLNKSNRTRKYIDRQTYNKALLLVASEAPMKVWPEELGICMSTAFYLRRKIRNKEDFFFKDTEERQEKPRKKRTFISEDVYNKAVTLTNANVPTRDWPQELGLCKSTASYLKRKILMGRPFSLKQTPANKTVPEITSEVDDHVEIKTTPD